MHKKLYSLVLMLSFSLAALAQQIKSPSEFLGYKLGDQFTPHYRIAEYFRYVAGVSKNIKLQQYGTTNEGRPLMLAFIASDENIGRLDEIRDNNMKLAGLTPGTGSTGGPVVLWLSYNVHGNEPASSEAAMQTLYDLVNTGNAQTQQWLKNTVIIIDPCLNPDGRDRYVNFYNSVRGVTPDPYNQAREHMEPWPGGRVNHYYFDLNRDWAWQTQKEVQARLVVFNQWLPQIHVDYHEQGYNNPYYFAPAAEPFHKDITVWQREFQTIIGKNNAKYFDQHGWTYFTKEEFDLLYPSYGDTYPIYNGSIGMTFEQGGISAGLAVLTRSGDTLTLADRIEHHHTTGLSTIEMASAYATKLLTEYKKFFDNGRTNPPGEYKGYVIKNDNDDKMDMLAELLTKNGIKYSFGLNHTAAGYNYFNGKQENFDVKPKDMVISAYQPKAVLLNVLLEPKTFIPDSNTYDITAWSLPYAYGLKAYGLKEPLANPSPKSMTPESASAQVTLTHAYAYALPWQSVTDVKFLAELYKNHIKVRYSETPFEAGGKKFSAGSLVVERAGNNRADFDKMVTDIAARNNRKPVALTSGFVEKGADLGSSSIRSMRQPKVMLLTGDQINSEEMGEIWHLFEQQINYPVTLVRVQDLNRIKISDFDVAIFPDGNYNDLPLDKLQGWIRDGGRLIALGDAVGALVGKGSFGIKRKEDKKDDAKSKPIRTYEARNRDDLKSSVPGAIYKINLDNTHPLGFGYPNYYYTLKLSDDVYDFFGDEGWNVGTVKKDNYVSGFVGQKSKAKIVDGMLIGVESMGRGSVVYFVDDPLFRSFWENGKLMFSNAVFMVGQ
ncbi:M14 metallopeptidase family protein [Mucilaginibacter agri]|uniref:Zinc carboxypeptidase n=1 Tax=Mucilaginibacter agri TaxID=2695265 RepID=A0A966DSD9_9SPHI|nr:M14 metallopeptidase family protein [Mucilaginibacter agri]NCD69505.1 zinc carboxypeptidase [Mucilaginibacter agri]